MLKGQRAQNRSCNPKSTEKVNFSPLKVTSSAGDLVRVLDDFEVL